MGEEILFLSPFFYPEPISTGKYNTSLVEGLVRSGQRVAVVTSHPFYPNWRPDFSNAALPGAIIVRGGLRVRYPQSVVLRRLVLDLWYSMHAVASALKSRSSSIVVAVFPPTLHFLFVQKLFRSRRKVGIVHDLQGVMSVANKNSLVRRFAGAVGRYLEKEALQGCDLVIFLSQAMAAQCIRAYNLNPARCKVRYPFATHATSGNGHSIKKVLPDGKQHIVYSGALGEKQDPWNLLELFIRLTMNNLAVHCHIFSGGPLFESLKTEAHRRGLERIFFHPLVTEDELAILYERSSVQIIPQKQGTSAGAFPSKLPNLLDAGVPIFAITDAGSELEQVLCAVGFGRSVNSWDIETASDALLRFLDEESRRTHAQRRAIAEHYVKKHFDLSHLVNDILKG